MSRLNAGCDAGRIPGMKTIVRQIMTLLLAVLPVFPAQAGEDATTHASSHYVAPFDAQQAFNTKFATYLRAESQTPLPLPAIQKTDWPKLTAGLALHKVFVEADRYYLAKVYTFTLYQAADGRYYLDVKGGFWGMDQLYYGPFGEADLK